MPHTETTLPQLTPPNAFEELGGIAAGRQPKREFEIQDIQRRIAEAGLQQQSAQEHRLEQDQRLKQFGALSTIAKVIHALNLPQEAKTRAVQNLTNAAIKDNQIIQDKAFFEALVDQPNELDKFLSSYTAAKQRGADDFTALNEGNQGISDPEVQKLVGETFKSIVVERSKSRQGKAINPNDVDALIASGGNVVGETIPPEIASLGREDRLKFANRFQTEQKEKRQILVPEAFGQQKDLAKIKAEILSAVKAESELADLNSVDTLVNSIGSLADALIIAENPLELAKQAASLKAGAISRTNPTAAAYEAQSVAFVGSLARTLSGERGVLTDRDIIRVGGALPGFTDTKQIKDYKIGNLKLLVDAAKEGKQARIEGRPVKSFQDRIQRLLLNLEGVKSPPAPPPGTIPSRR